MPHFLLPLARGLLGTPPSNLALYLLGNVRGFPPIVQTVHLISVAVIMGSIVLIDLRVLGLALPSQTSNELVKRLMPWTWWALPFFALSGLIFILARPARYAVNPVFGLKFVMLVPAIVLGVVFHRVSLNDATFWDRTRGRRVLAKTIACGSLLLWLGVVLAGRWIAYANYLF